MCGKFRCLLPWQAYRDLLDIGGDTPAPGAAGAAEELGTPGRWANVVHLDETGMRIVTPMLWGWPKVMGGKPSRGLHIHARAEEIDTRPTWAEAFCLRRGMILVASFNEGDELPGGKTRQWVCRPAGGGGLALGVIHQEWPTADGELVPSFVMVTTEPCPVLAARNITRMPALIPQPDAAVWLGETAAPPAAVKAVLRPYEGELAVEEEARLYPRPSPPRRTRRDDGRQPGLF